MRGAHSDLSPLRKRTVRGHAAVHSKRRLVQRVRELQILAAIADVGHFKRGVCGQQVLQGYVELLDTRGMKVLFAGTQRNDVGVVVVEDAVGHRIGEFEGRRAATTWASVIGMSWGGFNGRLISEPKMSSPEEEKPVAGAKHKFLGLDLPGCADAGTNVAVIGIHQVIRIAPGIDQRAGPGIEIDVLDRLLAIVRSRVFIAEAKVESERRIDFPIVLEVARISLLQLLDVGLGIGVELLQVPTSRSAMPLR